MSAKRPLSRLWDNALQLATTHSSLTAPDPRAPTCLAPASPILSLATKASSSWSTSTVKKICFSKLPREHLYGVHTERVLTLCSSVNRINYQNIGWLLIDLFQDKKTWWEVRSSNSYFKHSYFHVFNKNSVFASVHWKYIYPLKSSGNYERATCSRMETNNLFRPRSMFMCFVWFREQTALTNWSS